MKKIEKEWVLSLTHVLICPSHSMLSLCSVCARPFILYHADRKYSKLNNDYELTLDMSTDIRASFDDNNKQINYNFIKIADLSNVEVNASVDVVAIVRSAEECKSIISQKMGGKELFKRELVLYDDSNTEVRLTLWGEKAQEEFNWSEVPVLALKNVGVGEYNG